MLFEGVSPAAIGAKLRVVCFSVVTFTFSMMQRKGEGKRKKNLGGGKRQTRGDSGLYVDIEATLLSAHVSPNLDMYM